MKQVTGAAIRQALASRGAVLVMTSSSGGTTDTIVDRHFASVIRPSHDISGAWVRIPYATGAAPEGEVSQVTYVDTDTGTIHVSPAFTALVPSGAPYEIWLHGADPDLVDQCRDYALTTLTSRWVKYPVTMVPDGDMESESTAYYTAVGSGVTLAFSPDTTMLRSIVASVSTAASSVGLQSGSFLTSPGDGLLVSVPCKLTTEAQPVTLAVLNADTGSNFATVTTPSAVSRWTYCTLSASVPSGVRAAQVQVTYNASKAGSLVVGPIGCQFTSLATPYIWLPDHVESVADIGQLFELNPATGAFREILGYREPAFGAAVRVTFVDPPSMAYPIFYEKRTFYRALQSAYASAADRKAGDQALTTCPIQYAAEATAYALALRMLRQQPDSDYWRVQFSDLARTMNSLEARYGAAPKFVRNVTRQSRIPQLKV